MGLYCGSICEGVFTSLFFCSSMVLPRCLPSSLLRIIEHAGQAKSRGEWQQRWWWWLVRQATVGQEARWWAAGRGGSCGTHGSRRLKEKHNAAWHTRIKWDVPAFKSALASHKARWWNLRLCALAQSVNLQIFVDFNWKLVSQKPWKVRRQKMVPYQEALLWPWTLSPPVWR